MFAIFRVASFVEQASERERFLDIGCMILLQFGGCARRWKNCEKVLEPETPFLATYKVSCVRFSIQLHQAMMAWWFCNDTTLYV